MKYLKLISMTMLISLMITTPVFAGSTGSLTGEEDSNIEQKAGNSINKTVVDGDMHDGIKTATVVDESLKGKEALAHYEAAQKSISGIFDSIKVGSKSFEEIKNEITSAKETYGDTLGDVINDFKAKGIDQVETEEENLNWAEKGIVNVIGMFIKNEDPSTIYERYKELDEGLSEAYGELGFDKRVPQDVTESLFNFDRDKLNEYLENLTEEEKKAIDLNDTRYALTLETSDKAEELMNLTGLDATQLGEFIKENDIDSVGQLDNTMDRLNALKKQIEDLYGDIEFNTQDGEDNNVTSEEILEGVIKIAGIKGKREVQVMGKTIITFPEGLGTLIELYEKDYGIKLDLNTMRKILSDADNFKDFDFGVNPNGETKLIKLNSEKYYYIDEVVFKIRREDGSNFTFKGLESQSDLESYAKEQNPIADKIKELTGSCVPKAEISNKGRTRNEVVTINYKDAYKDYDTFRKNGFRNSSYYTDFRPTTMFRLKETGVYFIEVEVYANVFADYEKEKTVSYTTHSGYGENRNTHHHSKTVKYIPNRQNLDSHGNKHNDYRNAEPDINLNSKLISTATWRLNSSGEDKLIKIPALIEENGKVKTNTYISN